MTTPNFAIVNMRDGIRRDVQSFLVSNDSFPTLENAYLFRGRIQRRSCFTTVGNDGRLKGTIGTTDGGGNITLEDGTFGTGIPAGEVTFIINGDTLTDPGGVSPVILLTTGVTTGTLNRTTGVLTTNAPAAAVIYIPSLPVMGLRTLEQAAINDELLMAFDTRYSYIFDVGSNDFIFQNTFRVTNNPFIWTGTDSDFFWSTNYFQAFWATNNVEGFHAAVDASPVIERDGIRWYDGSAAGQGWSNFNPRLNSAATSFLLGGLIILPYKNRLVILNTLEGINLAGATRFPQRARWCQNGTPFYVNAPAGVTTQISAWDSGVNDIGKGGFNDAPTSEVIVSAEFIKDTLIVYFERSTWQLVYTYNETLPFVWQKINTELGADSTFSTVPFDRGAFTVGNYGIITCDSVNVQRIDQKIPDEVFQIQNKNNGVKRVHGIRDYTSQLVYWTAPFNNEEDNDSPSYDVTYPNQVIVYSYIDGSWAEFDDCFTCFGYWQRFADVTWAQLTKTWEETFDAWNAASFQARFPDVIAGNQRGFVMIFSQIDGRGRNTPSLPISNISFLPTTIHSPNHNLINNQYVLITGVLGTANINGLVYKVTIIDADNFIIDNTTASGTYTGAGLITHIPNFLIQTKEFNPFYESGDSLRVNFVDVYLDRTTNGQFDAQFYTSDNTSVPIEEILVNSFPELMPTYSTPSPTANFQANQNKIWHRIYTNSFGSFVQNIFTLTDTQIRNLDIATEDFILHGLIYNVSQSGRVSYDI